jgi:Tfp pilus assembly protein PilF
MQKLKESRESNAKTPFMDQQMIDYMANEHFEAGDVQQAVEISKLDIFAYPNSPVAYGVLAEAYLAQGQKDLARQNA